MKLTQKGQVTIPKQYRNQYGLTPNTEVVFEAAEGGVLIRPAPKERTKRLKAALKRARGSANTGMSTDEILAMTRDA